MPPPVHALRALDLPYAVCGDPAPTHATMTRAHVTCRQCQRRLMRGASAATTQSEASWQRSVIEMARTAGWMVYHTRDARRSPAGFMDLVMAHETPGHPLLCVELKTETGVVSNAQEAWLKAIGGSTGIVTAVWRPSMLESVIEFLRG